MHEYVTKAISLGYAPHKEFDVEASLYTELLGRIDVRVISGRKIKSRFLGHLNPLNLVTVRIVEKNKFTLADVLCDDTYPNLRSNMNTRTKALRLIFFLKNVAPACVPDAKIWEELCSSFNKNEINIHKIMSHLGYDPSYAKCDVCGGDTVAYFLCSGHNFLCKSCNSTLNESTVLLD